MAHITVTREPNNLLITVEGDLTSDQMLETVQLYYNGTLSPNILWDFTKATLRTVRMEQFRAVALVAKALIKERPNGRTASVVCHDEVYALTCLYAAIAGLEEIPIEYSVFKTMTEARQWLSDGLECKDVGENQTRNPWQTASSSKTC